MYGIRGISAIALSLLLCGCGSGGGGGYFPPVVSDAAAPDLLEVAMDMATGCQPQCGGRRCGSDGCGGTCGSCDQGFKCDNGTCVAGCTPNCGGKVCGSDGCGGSCGSCPQAFACMAGQCGVDPTGLWVLTVTTGKVSQFDRNGASWDTLGGAPDPFVCLSFNNQRTCTAARQDIFTPTWNFTFPTATAAALMLGVTVEIFDEDLSQNDTICSAGVVPVTNADFTRRTWAAACTYGSFQATLNPR